MALYAHLTREIYDGPAGPKVGAFFDLDGTLLAGFSSVAFFRDRLLSGYLAPRHLLEALFAAASFELGQIGFSGLVTGAAGMLTGLSEASMEALGERIFERQLASEIYPESWRLVHAHRHMGHTLTIVSSATRFQIEPLARELGIPHVLCTQLEVRDGAFTGSVVRPICYGEGKAIAASELAVRHGIDLERSYFYTDSDEDLPLLEIVGYPRPTNPNRRLAAIAGERGWPAKRFTSRGAPGVAEIVRTGLVVGSIVPSFLLGLPVAVLNKTYRDAINLGVTTWGELGTALAGIKLQVRGEEHLWSQRPAVFIFNHQSAIDPLLICKLLRRDVVGIARRGVRWNPILGPWLSLMGTVFIERFNREDSASSLEPAIRALRQGLSIAVAPEGTRSPTPRLGRFKKGAFRLARAARVPIVPITFRNALDALPKHGRVVRPANIEVIVHPPISTEGWTSADLDREIEKIHELYTSALDS